MKKIISMVLVVLLICPLLTACKNTNEGEPTTDELILRFNVKDGICYEENELNKAMVLYKKKYPNVNVIIEKEESVGGDTEAYYTKLKTDLMAGSGPDIIYTKDWFYIYNDLYKMQESGAFADLTKFIKNDKEFQIDNYNKTLFDSLKYNDKQYIIPATYQMPFFISTKEILKSHNIDMTKCSTSKKLLDELTAYWKRNKDVDNPANLFQYPRCMMFFHHYMGLNSFDNKNKTVDTSQDIFKQALDFWKLAYPYETKKTDVLFFKHKSQMIEEYFKSGKQATGFESYDYQGYFENISALSMIGEPVMTPWRDINGNIQVELSRGALISNHSKNKQNAWNFIKIMLGEESQSEMAFSLTGIPVRKSILTSLFKNNFKEGLQYGNVDGTTTTAKPIDEFYLNQFIEFQNQIKGAYIRFPVDREFFYEFIPYFEGKKSYNDCIKSAESMLKIYLSE